MRKMGRVNLRNHLAGLRELQQGKTDGLVIIKKKIDLQ